MEVAQGPRGQGSVPVLTAPSTQGGASGTAGSPPAMWARACSRAALVPHGRVGGRGPRLATSGASPANR